MSVPFTNLSERDLLRKPGTLSGNNLRICHDLDEKFQFFELNTPYMIMLETCEEASQFFSFYQFTPDGYSSDSFVGVFPDDFRHRAMHQHAFLELMFVVSGSVINHMEKQTFVYGPGQCCIMNRNIRHCEEFTGTFQAVFLMLKDEFLLQLFDDYQQEKRLLQQKPVIHPIFELLLDSRRPDQQFSRVYLDVLPILPAAEIFELTNPLFNQLILEISDQKPGMLFFLKGILTRLFDLLCDPNIYCMNRVSSTLEHQDYLFAKITHLLAASHGRCTREDLSRQLNYNDEYLNRIVKKHTGKTVLAYGREIYMQEAKRLLLDTPASISEIIEKLGFSNRSHFYRMFEQTFHETPMEYRKHHRKTSL